MARKKTVGTLPESGSDGGEKARPSEVRQVISKGKLLKLMSAARSAKNDISEISGTMGQAIATAVENNYLNRKVFRQIVALDRMEPEKLATWLEDFEHYLDISGLKDRAASAPRMEFGPGEEQPEEDEGETGRRQPNVAAFPQPH